MFFTSINYSKEHWVKKNPIFTLKIFHTSISNNSNYLKQVDMDLNKIQKCWYNKKYLNPNMVKLVKY